MSASECKADVFRFNFGSLRLNVHFSPKRTLLPRRNSNFQRPLPARSGHLSRRRSTPFRRLLCELNNLICDFIGGIVRELHAQYNLCSYEAVAMMRAITITIDHRLCRRILIVLVVGVLGLSLLSLIANIMYIQDLPGSGMAVKLFGVDEETSLPTWWTSVVLALLGAFTAVVGTQQAKNRSELVSWWALAAGFIFFSIDDGVMLHERVGYLFDVSGEFHNAPWMIVWLPLAAVVGGVVLWRLWRVDRRLVIGLTIGAIVFLAGAVGLELINVSNRSQAQQQAQTELAQSIEQRGEASLVSDKEIDRSGTRNYAYVIGTTAEELLEMLGAVIWFAVILRAGINGPQSRSGRKNQPNATT